MSKIYPKLAKKLTPQRIKALRAAYVSGVHPDHLAKKFGVHRTTIDWHLGELKQQEGINI